MRILLRKTYLWIEDREGKAGFIFWKTMMQQLCPDVIVVSKNNNSELVKAVKNLTDEENEYIIVFDRAFDNIQVVREHQLLQKYISARNNVHELRIICFEYVLLEFGKLLDWIYASEDEFFEKRAVAIAAREKLLAAVNSSEDYKLIEEIKFYKDKLDTMNIEQLAARLLFELTRNTGFEVSKGVIGDCWVNSCCDWQERQGNDVCGLDENRITILEKMQLILKYTTLEHEFRKLRLEVLS